MDGLTLPFQQVVTKFNGDGTAFEVDCQEGSVAIAGKVTNPNPVFQTGVYGELGGPYSSESLLPIGVQGGPKPPPPGPAQPVPGPGFLTGAVVGQTNVENAVAVLGASLKGIGVQGISDSGVAMQASSNTGSALKASSGGIGVLATSRTLDAVNGTSSSPAHAGVSANNDGGGFGLWARAKTAGYFEGDGGNAIQAVDTSDVDAIVATSSSPNHAALAAHNNSGGFGVWAASDSNAGSVGGIGVYARGHKYAGQFDGDVQVNGTLTATKDVVLGSDCAEDFDLAVSAQIEPGTVMVLTETGAIEPSGAPYDKKVAGVISGAGDYQPGLILGRRDPSPGRMPLALVGKVYCKADAQYGPIKVGDLLTTSATPGHAMRAVDPLKAFGAVIGKALQPLGSGQALTPIRR
jgi:hypothetical protein